MLMQCVYLRITNKLHPLIYSCYINNTLIQHVDYAEYLGVFIDKNVNWNEHTGQVVSMANRVGGLLQHNLKKCSRDIKAPCFLFTQ